MGIGMSEDKSRIVYTTTLGGGMKPVEVVGGPDTIESLRRGDVLQRLDTEERILVLEANEDGKTGTAMQLPNGHGEALPVSVSQLNGWTGIDKLTPKRREQATPA